MTLIILNAFDALVTCFLIEKGLATEANPIMGAAYDISPAFFIYCKLVGVTICALWLHRLQARKALLFVTFVYSILALYHVRSLLVLAGVW